jgi:hypothetical protein
MLPIGIENNYVLESALQPMAQAGHDRRSLSLIALVNDDFGAGRTRRCRRLIGRTVIDHEDVIDLKQSPLNHRSDVFFFAKRRDHCRDCFSIHRAGGR